MIRTSQHSTKDLNPNKRLNYEDLVKHCRDAAVFYVDWIWEHITDYNCPKFISTIYLFPINTPLYQRALKCLATQACGMVKAVTEKPKKVLYVINKLKSEGEDASKLEEWLKNHKMSKPEVPEDFKVELNSICADLQIGTDSDKFMFLQLKSLGKKFGKIRIPLKEYDRSIYWKNRGKVMTSFLVGKDFVDIRYQVEVDEVQDGKIVGMDQGQLTCLSVSDGQTTVPNKDGWDLDKILDKLKRRQKGSKGFKEAQQHRKNYINESINKLNLTGVKEVRLEQVLDLRFENNAGRKNSHWTYPLIKNKVMSVCESEGFIFKEQSCVYRSQRCSQCGLVRKSNRQGKLYCCSGCGYVGDADINAAKNHEIDLPDVDVLRGRKYNLSGFYWLESGCYTLSLEELIVPHTNKS